MNKVNKKLILAIISIIVISIMVISIVACDKELTNSDSNNQNSNTSATITVPSADNMFTEKDLEEEVDLEEAATITLSNNSISSSSSSVSISGSTATITKAGTYTISGTLNDGYIVVDAKDEKVTLVLQNADITSSTFAGLYIKDAEKVFLVLQGTNSITTTASTFTQIDDAKVDGALFSSDDICIKGDGSLTISSTSKLQIV